MTDPAGPTILAVDAGSSALKAALVTLSGTILRSAQAGYGDAPAPHRQDPERWWGAAREAIDELGPTSLVGITATGTMENLIPVTDAGDAVGHAIMYTDPCGTPFHDTWREALEAIDAAAVLGNAPEPLMTAFKCLWLAANEPDTTARCDRYLLSPKDFLLMRMTGRAVTDPTTATTSGLMDISRREWSLALLQMLTIDAARLPEILPAGARIGALEPTAAAALGLPTGVPVFNGCGDAGATTVGSGCAKAGDVSAYLGTSGWVARVVSGDTLKQARPCYRLAHPLTGNLIEVLPVLSAGACGDWARRQLGLTVDEAEAAARESDARQSLPVVFLPYINGERSPFVDLDVRGAFLGLDGSHTSGDLYRAVLEGVGFAVAANLDVLYGKDRPAVLHLGGGGAQSEIWRSLIADCTGVPVRVVENPQMVTVMGAYSVVANTGSGRTGAKLTDVEPRPDRLTQVARRREAFSRATDFARSTAGMLMASTDGV